MSNAVATPRPLEGVADNLGMSSLSKRHGGRETSIGTKQRMRRFHDAEDARGALAGSGFRRMT
jgi:hypothetical protein